MCYVYLDIDHDVVASRIRSDLSNTTNYILHACLCVCVGVNIHPDEQQDI